MLREGLRLGRRQRLLVYWCFAALFLTGVLWLGFHYFLRGEGEFGEAQHPLEPWWLKLHGGAAMLFLMILGSLVRGHMRVGWRARRNRLSGGTLAGACGVLIVSGWALYYVGSEAARPWISAAHWGLGLLTPVIIVTHVVFGRRTRRLREVPPTTSSRVPEPSRDRQPAIAARLTIGSRFRQRGRSPRTSGSVQRDLSTNRL